MITELISLLPTVMNTIQGFAGQSEADKLAEKERGLKLTMPPEMLKAEGMARELAAMGLPGYEKYKEDIGQLTPTTVNQARSVAQSPSQLIDLMSRSQSATNAALRDLEVRDTQQNVQNKQNYQNFLGQKGQMALGIQGANNQTDLMALQQESQGTKDLFQSLNNAIGSGINTYSTLSMLGYQKDYLDKLGESWKTKETPAPNTVGQPNWWNQPDMFSQPTNPSDQFNPFKR